MSGSKRPSTSSLRRFITSRPYVTVAELRRRFGLDDPDAMARLQRDGTEAWIGLPEREATKLQDLWERDELGLELSVEVRAPVVVGVYPMRIARYVMDGSLASSERFAERNGGPAKSSQAQHPSSWPTNSSPNGVGGNGSAGTAAHLHPGGPEPSPHAPVFAEPMQPLE